MRQWLGKATDDLLAAELILAGRLDAARALTPHAVANRYPGEEEPVSQASARRHLDLARSVLDTVTEALRPYLDARPPGA